VRKLVTFGFLLAALAVSIPAGSEQTTLPLSFDHYRTLDQIYGALKALVGIRLDPEEEYNGADIAIHRISATPERDE